VRAGGIRERQRLGDPKRQMAGVDQRGKLGKAPPARSALAR
jgi:hypothetical protein